MRVGVQNGRLEQRGAQETAKTPETPNSQVKTGMDNFIYSNYRAKFNSDFILEFGG